MASRTQAKGTDSRIVRVAIVGGGCAGLAAAWELSQRNLEPGDVQYEIAVYEKSWRLGGKGASVRDEHGRILEHGLHVWMGFYENAFYLMRECSAYLKSKNIANGPYDSIEAAFFPEPHLGAALQSRCGEWEAWTSHFPPAPGAPGTPIDEKSNPFSLASYVSRMLGIAKTVIHSIIAPLERKPAPSGSRREGGYPWEIDAAADGSAEDLARPDARSRLDENLDLQQGNDPSATPGAQIASIARLLRIGALTTAGGLLQALMIVESILHEQSSQSMPDFRLLQYIDAIVTHTRKFLADFVDIDEDVRRRTEIIDLVMTVLVGLYRDKVLFDPNGLNALDDIDCRDWLRKHGATDASRDSPFIRALYDLAFAYRDGDKRFPALAAGQGLRGLLRMFFTYRGSLIWRMRAGMGDVIFAPLYRALAHRGVRFCFNHALAEVEFNDLSDKNSNRVTKLKFKVEYKEDPDDPTHPEQWSPLDEQGFWPESATKRFKRSRASLTLLADQPGPKGFDAVVFALGKDDFVKVCAELCDKLDRYKQMAQHVKTVATQAVQFWFRDDLTKLGWHGPPVIMTGVDFPLDSWADMAHILAAEREVKYKHDRPKSVMYLCGVIPENKVQDAIRQGNAEIVLQAGVRRTALEFLNKWDAVKELVTPDQVGARAFNGQHFRANYAGSDRYALSLPGTLKHRVSPLDGSVENMTIAGDWTDCGFNEGCVEAAVMSGRLAAHAITGERPSLDDIVGYNHP